MQVCGYVWMCACMYVCMYKQFIIRDDSHDYGDLQILRSVVSKLEAQGASMQQLLSQSESLRNKRAYCVSHSLKLMPQLKQWDIWNSPLLRRFVLFRSFIDWSHIREGNLYSVYWPSVNFIHKYRHRPMSVILKL